MALHVPPWLWKFIKELPCVCMVVWQFNISSFRWDHIWIMCCWMWGSLNLILLFLRGNLLLQNLAFYSVVGWFICLDISSLKEYLMSKDWNFCNLNSWEFKLWDGDVVKNCDCFSIMSMCWLVLIVASFDFLFYHSYTRKESSRCLCLILESML